MLILRITLPAHTSVNILIIADPYFIHTVGIRIPITWVIYLFIDTHPSSSYNYQACRPVAGGGTHTHTHTYAYAYAHTKPGTFLND